MTTREQRPGAITVRGGYRRCRQDGTTPMMQDAGFMADQAASSRQFVILSSQEPREEGTLSPIGARSEVLEKLAGRNTSPESPDTADVLYGPGIRIEMTPAQDPIVQMLVTVVEEEIGWQVLTRLIHHFQWKLLDPNTGRELTPPSL